MSDYNISYIWTAVDKFTPTLSRINSQIDESRNRMGGLNSTFKTFGENIRNVGGGLTKYLTTTITAAGVASVWQAERFREMGRSLEYVAGGAAKGKELFETLKKTEDITPFDLENLVAASKALRAYGMETKNIQPTIMRLGNIAAGANASIEDVTRAYGRIATRGTMSNRELFMFMSMQIPILETLAKQQGVSQSMMAQMVFSKRVSAAMVDRALSAMSGKGGIYEDAMHRKMMSLPIIIMKIKNAVEEAAGSLGDVLEKSLPIHDVFIKLRDTLRAIPPLIIQFSTAHPILTKMIVWGAIFAAVLGPVIMALGTIFIFIGQIAIAWGALSGLVAGAGTAIAALGGVFGGVFAGVLPVIGSVALGIAAVVSGIYLFITAARMIAHPMETFKSLCGIISDIVYTLEHIVDVMNKIPMVKGAANIFYDAINAIAPREMPAGAAAGSNGVAVQQGAVRSQFDANITINAPRGAVKEVITKGRGPINPKLGYNMAGG